VAIPDGAAATERQSEVLRIRLWVRPEGVTRSSWATGWPESGRWISHESMRHLVEQPIIVDTKNLLDSVTAARHGIPIMGVGRPSGAPRQQEVRNPAAIG